MTKQATSMTDLSAELWRKKFSIVLITLICLVVTYVLLSFLPKMYESSASVLVEARSSIFLRAADDTSAGAAASGVTDDVLMASQVELAKSADTRLRVVQDLNLVEVAEFAAKSSSPLDPIFALMGRQSDLRDVEQVAIARLLKQMTVIRERDSRVISIYVRAQDRQLAADIANALATTLISRRAEQSIDDTAEATQWLEGEINKLRTRVSDAEAAVAQYRVQNDLFVGTNNTTLVDQQLSNISTQITSAQERKNTARSRANLIRQLLNSGQSITGVSDVQNSVVIQRLAEDKATLARERAQLLSTLLPNHPDIVALTAQIDELTRQINEEGELVADALDVEAQIEANLEASLRDDLARLKLSASDASTSNVRLLELEREASAQRDLLETYLLRYRDAVARTDSNASLPDLRQITIATPALTPASPQTMMILIAVLIVALMVQLGTIILRHFASSLLRPEDETERASDARAEPEMDHSNPVAEKQNRENLRQRAAQSLQAAREKSRNSNNSDTRPKLTETSAADIAAAIGPDGDNLVVLIGYGAQADLVGFADKLTMSLLDNGLTVALVDAASKRKSRHAGLADLAADQVEFGDVVRETEIAELTEVQWGTLPHLDPQSEKPVTLVEALCDLNDAVLVPTGIAGRGASLQMFAGTDAKLVVVADQALASGAQKQILIDAERLGFTNLTLTIARKDNRKDVSEEGLISA